MKPILNYCTASYECLSTEYTCFWGQRLAIHVTSGSWFSCFATSILFHGRSESILICRFWHIWTCIEKWSDKVGHQTFKPTSDLWLDFLVFCVETPQTSLVAVLEIFTRLILHRIEVALLRGDELLVVRIYWIFDLWQIIQIVGRRWVPIVLILHATLVHKYILFCVVSVRVYLIIPKVIVVVYFI